MITLSTSATNIPYVEFPRQPFSNNLKTISHVQTDILHIVQGFIDALTQQRLRYLQTLAAYMRSASSSMSSQ